MPALLLAIALLALLGIFCWQRINHAAPPPDAVESPRDSSAKAARSPRLKTESEIGEADPGDWREWLRELERAPATTVLSEIVRDGETFITQGWEGPDGRLYFTMLTPRAVKAGDGTELIDLSSREIAIHPGGREDWLAAPRILTRAGQTATVEIGGVDGYRYRLEMTADSVPGGAFHLRAGISRTLPALAPPP
jgi:hypothetical protein